MSKIISLIVSLFISSVLFAQTGDEKMSEPKEGVNSLQLDNFSDKLTPKFLKYSRISRFQPISFYPTCLQRYYQIGEKHHLRKVSLMLSKEKEVHLGLGGHERFMSGIQYNFHDKMKLTFGLGLVKQGTGLNKEGVYLHYVYDSSLEYRVTDVISAYVYGQYLSGAIDGTQFSYDAFSYMNPLFIQTETGAGFRTKFKNVNADIGVKSMHDTQIKLAKPINTMNTKVTIGF